MSEISLVLLNKPALPDMIAVVNTLQKRHPSLGARLVKGPRGSGRQKLSADPVR